MLKWNERLAALKTSYPEPEDTLTVQHGPACHCFRLLVSIVNLASVRQLGQHIEVDPLRFRANLYVGDLPPWCEFDWLDRTISVGEAQLRVIDCTRRCAAVDVEPQTGRRGLNIPKALQRQFGHGDFGVYAEVIAGGTLRIGDNVIAPAA